MIPNKVRNIQCIRTLTSAFVSWTKPVTHCENFGFKYVVKYTYSNKPVSQMTVIETSTNKWNIKAPQWNSEVKFSVTAMCIDCKGVGPGQIATCFPSEFNLESASMQT